MNGKILLKAVLICVVLLAVGLIPISSQQGPRDYDPWADLNDDGDIDIRDVSNVARRYGTYGTPFVAKAALEYDSGWVNITDKAGQCFNVTHSLNSTDVMVDIQGKTTLDGGVHQRHLGLTAYTPGWSRTYGGTLGDTPRSVVQTSDGGYAIAGATGSFGAGGWDLWLVKTDAFGNKQWNKTYGGPNHDFAYSLVQTVDGGYALAGYTKSFGAGVRDMWLVKTDSAGVMQWNRTYGGEGTDAAYSLVQTVDGGYALAGYTHSFGGGGAGGPDMWLVKTDSAGNSEWNRTYGWSDYTEYAYSLVQTVDGGYALAGYREYSLFDWDFWLVKTNSMGYPQWSRRYGGIYFEVAYSLVQTVDGGYALAGYTVSFGAGSVDFWLVKTDAFGNKQWNRTYGGADSVAWSVVQTSDGGYALVGYTVSFGAGVEDFWLVKTDAVGNVQWNRTYGGADSDVAWSVVQTVDGGYVLAGETWSFGSGDYDFWLVKTEVESGLVWTDSTANTITLYRGATDACWNHVRVRIWKIKETP